MKLKNKKTNQRIESNYTLEELLLSLKDSNLRDEIRCSHQKELNKNSDLPNPNREWRAANCKGNIFNSW